jgi:hypothetical protein
MGMAGSARHGRKLSFSEKLARLRTRLKDPEWRRYGKLLFVGKALGVTAVLLIITVVSGLFFTVVHAADAEVKAADVVNPLNTVWTLVAAFLVFGMQVGFTMLEAGFCRSRETVNVLMECIVDTCLCGILFFAFGFAFMFSHGNGFIGDNRRRVPGILAVSVRLCGHLLDDHIRRHDRAHWVRGRSALQRCGFGFHLSHRRSLGVGAGRLSGHDGQRWTLSAIARHGLP